jgi:hypothetical protein
MRSCITNTIILIILFTNITANHNIYRDLRLTTIPCLQETCNIYGGECLGDGIGKTCICKSGYTTFPEDSTIKCNYQKFFQETAFIYEAIMPIGIGHFYSGRYRFGIIKCIFYFIGYLLIFLVRLFSKPKEEYSVTVISISAASFIFLIGMLVWLGIDLYNFGFNKYLDGNNIVLLPWGEDPNGILRLVFS